MSCGEKLRDLLRPLGVYRWEGTFQWAELQSEGKALDQMALEMESLQREMNLASAQEEGLKAIAGLIPWYIGNDGPEDLRRALTVLLRIGEDSVTLQDINAALQACGIAVRVEETEDPLRLRVIFTGVRGIPADLQRLQAVIERILPCHLLAEYQFQCLTWTELEGSFSSWYRLEAAARSWESLEAYEP